MSYERQTFVDEVRDADGKIITKGTTIKAQHFKHIEDGIKANEDAIAVKQYKSKPDGVNVLILGDSITESMKITYDTETVTTTSYSPRVGYDLSYENADGETVKYRKWPTLFQQYVKCLEMRNYAQSGASYKDSDRESGYERRNVSYQVALALNDITNPNGAFTVDNFVADIIIFALGTNDGRPNDTYEEAMAKTVYMENGKDIDIDATLSALDRTKFCEAVRHAMLSIRRAFPEALGLCVLPIQRASSEFPGESLRDELRKMAERYGYIPLDGYGHMGIVRDLEINSGIGVHLKDGLHPNEVGQKMFARMIVQAINTYYIPLTEFVD